MTKSHKARMLAGEPYLASDPELQAEQLRAQMRLEEIAAVHLEEEEQRLLVLRELFAHLGEGAVVKPGFRCDYGYNIRIGARSFVNYDCVFLDCNRITIGADVLIGPGTHVYTAEHPRDALARRQGWETALPVTIEDGVWLGGRVVVCAGVTIGRETIVAAGGVVTESLPARVLAAGNPCRVVREL